MPKLNEKLCRFLTMPASGFLVLAGAAGALGFAFTMQYVFGVQPCELCLIQRVPFGLVIALALAALAWRPYRTNSRVLLSLCSALMFINAGIAFFHTGVELHWWAGTSGCHIPPLHASTVEDLRTKIMNMAVGHCDEISWTFLGLSMANWDIPYSSGLGLLALLAVFCRKKKTRT